MFYRDALKWLTIAIIAFASLILVLLLLGYLLKENEAVVTQLKSKLDHEAYQQQQRKNRQENPSFPALELLSSFEKSQQKIITENLSCHSDKECFLIHTDSQAVGCIVAVNTLGAAILLKATSANKLNTSSKDNCEQHYHSQTELLAHCRNNLCTF